MTQTSEVAWAAHTLHIRLAQVEDVPVLARLIETSVRALVSRDYTQRQVDSLLCHLYGVDSLLIADRTYFVAETKDAIIGSGGWSRRRTPFGGDQASELLDQSLRDPATDPAVIRAFFVLPDYTGRGVGRLLLETCEREARAEGFTRFEATTTKTAAPFYAAHGYRHAGSIDWVLPDGVPVVFERMVKDLEPVHEVS